MSTACFSDAGLILSSKTMSGAAGRASDSCSRESTSISTTVSVGSALLSNKGLRLLYGGRGRKELAGRFSVAGQMIVLDQDCVVQTATMVAGSTACHGVLFESAPTGGCFSGCRRGGPEFRAVARHAGASSWRYRTTCQENSAGCAHRSAYRGASPCNRASLSPRCMTSPSRTSA